MKLLNDKHGNFRLFGSQVLQHLNPACRVARSFPELGMSRLLISLSDYDIPIPKNNNRGFKLAIKYVTMVTIMGFVGILITFPELIQALALESLFSTIINFIYLGICANQNDIVISISVGTGIILGLFLSYECIGRRRRSSVYISG